ncbi:hypothetical protein [Thalassotalea sp. LPB0316]|nr:hypothetical protein [Thalassotalea sp. LPB0316]
MNFFQMLLNDPVVLFSFGGLAIVLLICAYYVYFFMKNIEENN